MVTLQIQHRVRDFETWKGVFDSDPVGRAAGGVRSHRISRHADDPNSVVIDLELDLVESAESFAERLRALWAEAGPRLGLENPTAQVLETVGTRTY